MNARALLIILALIVLAVVGYLAYANSDRTADPTDTATTTETGVEAPDDDGSGAPTAMTVTYGEDGFSPANITVPLGATITWVNSTDGRMWIGSNEHPTHTNYDGTSATEHCADGAPTSPTVFDQCGAGERYSFTFTKTGTWNYHNHARSSDRGSVTVTAAQ